MQAQATGSRRFGINGMVTLALAIGLLAIAAAAVAISTIEFGADQQANTLVAHPAPLQGEGRVDPANAVVTNPQTAPIIRHAAPFAGEGRMEMRFLEQNIWEHSGAPAEYQGLDEYQPQPEGLDYRFLEENLWNVGPAEAGTEATAVHPDTYPGDGLD